MRKTFVALFFSVAAHAAAPEQAHLAACEQSLLDALPPK
jgi:hypothetical protein